MTLLGDRTVEEYKEELLDLLEEFNQLRVLVNQLLLLAEGDAGQLCTVREPTRLDQIVLKAVDMFQAVSEVKGVALQIKRLDAIVLPADSSAARQVVNNLLDNAIKYTPPEAASRLELSCDDGSGRGVRAAACGTRGSGSVLRICPTCSSGFYRARTRHGRAIGSIGERVWV